MCVAACWQLLHSRKTFMYTCFRKQLSHRQLRRVGQAKTQGMRRVEQENCQAWENHKLTWMSTVQSQEAAPLLHLQPHPADLHIPSQTEYYTCATLPAAHV